MCSAKGEGTVPWVPQGAVALGQRPALDAHRAELPPGASSSRAPGDIWVWTKVDEEGMCSAKLQ